MKLSDLITLINRRERPFITLVLLSIALVSAIAGCTTLTTMTTAFQPLPTIASLVAGTAGGNEGPPAIAGTPAGFIPVAFGSILDPMPMPSETPVAVATLGPPLPAPTIVVAAQPVDFEAARATAQAQGKDIAFVKIGFHRGLSGNANGWGDYIRKLNDAGVPVFVKSVVNGGVIWEVQELMKENEAEGRYVPHVLVYRSTDKGFEDIYYDLSLTPEEAAELSWQANRDALPKELDKEYFWVETLNEPGRYGFDGNLQIERLGRFSLATAKLAVAEGYKYAALAFSTGIPEVGDWPTATTTLVNPNDWEDPAMLEFLRYAGRHKDQVAVALHEYSLTVKCIAPPCNESPEEGEADFIPYPYLVGRLQALFDTVDRHGIPRPTVMITEWGWEYGAVPEPEEAMEDIAWASWLYAAYPEVLGAAIWYLGGPWCCDIDDQTQRLIEPLTEYAASHYYIIDPGIGRIDPFLFSPNPPTLLEPNREGWATPFPRPRSMP